MPKVPQPRARRAAARLAAHGNARGSRSMSMRDRWLYRRRARVIFAATLDKRQVHFQHGFSEAMCTVWKCLLGRIAFCMDSLLYVSQRGQYSAGPEPSAYGRRLLCLQTMILGFSRDGSYVSAFGAAELRANIGSDGMQVENGPHKLLALVGCTVVFWVESLWRSARGYFAQNAGSQTVRQGLSFCTSFV